MAHCVLPPLLSSFFCTHDPVSVSLPFWGAVKSPANFKTIRFLTVSIFAVRADGLTCFRKKKNPEKQLFFELNFETILAAKSISCQNFPVPLKKQPRRDLCHISHRAAISLSASRKTRFVALNHSLEADIMSLKQPNVELFLSTTRDGPQNPKASRHSPKTRSCRLEVKIV